MARSASWAIRIEHEASLHQDNMFLTLTYDTDHLPDSYSVSVREVQLFMKRLRKSVAPKRIRYFAVGEYGERNGRPHYHIIIFGHRFDDCVLSRVTSDNHYCFTSETLKTLWPFGLHEIGTVTAASGGYVARYSLKKIGGDVAYNHYQRIHPLTGELVTVHPEFAVMSTHPGIGSGWFDVYECDAFPSDFLVSNGKKFCVPDYYKKRLKERYKLAHSRPDDFVPKDDFYPIAQKRRAAARAAAHNSTPDRLAVREEVARRRVERLNRDL